MAQVIYLALAAAFVVGSTWQVERQVFGRPLMGTQTGPNCSFLVGSFDEAITTGLARAAQEQGREKAEEAFENAVSTPLSAVEKHCTAPADRGAFVAASRLRDAAEATVDAQQSVLAPLRTALHARRNP